VRHQSFTIYYSLMIWSSLQYQIIKEQS